MSKHVYITGIGITCAIGNNVETVLESLFAGHSGIGAITLFNTVHRGVIPMAEVKMTTEELLSDTGYAGRRDFTRTSLLGIKAAGEAWQSSGITEHDNYRTGLISATTVGGMDRSEGFYAAFLSDPKKGRLIDIVNHDCGDSTERIAAHLGIRDFVTTVSTACSSSVNALMLGANLIKTGQLDRVVVGGTDSVTKFTLNGFNTLMILDKTGCHPFDENRAGLTLGEGAAYLVLESEEIVRKENKKVLAVVKGYGNANDAYHQTASSPDGTGAFLAMSKALAMSGLTPGEIDYINVHGTGTQNNDLSEGIAIQRIFGEQVPPFSSTKGFTGHTLGAAGAVEAVISVLTLQHRTIFPNLGFSTPMKELYIQPVTAVTTVGVGTRHAASQQTASQQTGSQRFNILSNSFGFGGNNSAVILGESE
jgi:3-oxoacyl-[acyl-carrier-protein] synthase-1